MTYMPGGYGLYLIFAMPALLLGLWAQFKIKSAFGKYSQVGTYSGVTGAQAARRMLDSSNLRDVPIEATRGALTDHYDPRTKTLRLSEPVYGTASIAAAGVAAHEAGHALQDATNYGPLKLRGIIIPVVQIGSWIGPIIFMIGLFMQSTMGTRLAWLGILLFSATAFFSIITLPVEFNASARAKAFLAQSGLVSGEEMVGVNKVLDAAALTYVAGALQSVSTIMYYAFMLLGRRRD